VTISPEVQAALDAIVQSRLLTEKAKQDVEKAAGMLATAVEEGRIRVEQSRLRKRRQQVTLQQLKQQQLEAAVCDRAAINAQAQLETAQAQQCADEQAQIDLAKEIALAELTLHTRLYLLQIALTNPGD
jgi:hypothetical protein